MSPLFFLLALLAGLSAVALRLKLPYPMLLVVAGGLVALLPLPAVVLSPDAVFLLFLPPLLCKVSHRRGGWFPAENKTFFVPSAAT
ncbi:hypothetical protein DDQ68_09895 [Hymenobacter nivis]|uniref:Cation/H+ exchanger domain-containing protein n=1 Tax=Hymenobacter nivis TaxID=1850093 RepID=A0A2Z3GMT9_9BACT|nr:hypothetical protein DDQ68_09895 [Hymenobacter nivis]